MFDVLYIFSITLALLGVSSLSIGKYRTSSFLIIFWIIIIFTMRDIVYDLSAGGSLFGIFSILFISMMMTLIFMVFYKTEQTKILLKLSTAFSLLSLTHLLFIMTYIKPIREMWYYHSPIFDFFYWHYGEIQIILTLYMISLFLKSGIMGLSNGFTKIFGHNPSRQRINSVGYIGDLPNSYRRIDNILLDRQLKKQSQKNNKGIQS